MGLTFCDKYSVLHFAVGVVVSFFKVSFWQWLVIHILFEIIENTDWGIKFISAYLTFWPGGKSYADAAINSIGDTIFAMLGFMVGRLVQN